MDSNFENNPTSTGQFQKKVYTRLSTSDISALFSKESMSSLSEPAAPKKIIATSVSHTLREEFKKTFLPLLIEVFELRQTIQNFKNQSNFPPFKSRSSSSPEEILKRLETLQNEIEETKRWVEGVVLQIAKGVQEAKEALQDPELAKSQQSSEAEKPKHFIHKLLKLFKNP